MHRACPRCYGEGLLVSLSKAQRNQRRSEGDRSLPSVEPAKLTRCLCCAGSGLVLRPGGSGGWDAAEAGSAGSVAIIGAGIGGAALALALQQRGIRVTVYERDMCFDMRKQGYGLTMQKMSGGAALAALGCALEGVGSVRNVAFTSEGRLLGQYGHAVHGKGAGGAKAGGEEGLGRRNVHLPRQALRRMLLNRLHPGTVQWGCRFVRYSEYANATDAFPEGAVELEFEGGRTENADICVGADGIFSNIRTQKINDPLSDLNLLVILGIVRGTPHALCKQTVFQVLDGTTRIYAMPFSQSPDGDGIIPAVAGEGESEGHAMMWQLSFPCPQAEARVLARDSATLFTTAMERCKGWPAPIFDLLSRTNVNLMAGYPAFDRDVLDEATLRGGAGSQRVTLIGDAAHPMSPFKGQGANQALVDAVQLARFLVRAPRFTPWHPGRSCFADTEAALAASEVAMCKRAYGKVRASREAAEALHSPAALREGNCVRALLALAGE